MASTATASAPPGTSTIAATTTPLASTTTADPDLVADAERIDDRAWSRSRRATGFGKVPYVGRAAYRHFEDPPIYQDRHVGVRIITP